MILAVSAVVIFIYGMLASMLGTILPGLGARLALTPLQLSYLALAQGIGLAATSVFAGALMDRAGSKLGILVGLAASIAGLLLLAHPSVLSSAMTAMVLLGIGGSLVIVGANTLVNDASGVNKASALNILNLFVGLGGMSTPFVAGNLLGSDAVAVAYTAAGAAVIALLATLVIPAVQHQAHVEAASAALFSEPMLYVLSAITFLYTACEFAMWNWLPKLLIANGIAAVTALNLLSLGFAGGMLLGRLFAARLLVRAAPVPVLLTCAFLMGATTLLIPRVPGTTATAGLVFAAGVAMAPIFPTTISIVGRLFARRSGTAIGFAITCGFSGLVASSPVIGLLADRNGLATALLLLPILALAVAAILVIFRRRLAAG